MQHELRIARDCFYSNFAFRIADFKLSLFCLYIMFLHKIVHDKEKLYGNENCSKYCKLYKNLRYLLQIDDLSSHVCLKSLFEILRIIENIKEIL